MQVSSPGKPALRPACAGGNMEYMSESEKCPKPPVPASTLILVRQEYEGFQVYLLRRSHQSGFMPGNYVFPGGTVDPGDRDAGFWKKHVDMDQEQIRSRFVRNDTALNMEDALAHGIAAVRETFEEASLLLLHGTGREADDLGRLWGRNLDGALPEAWLRDLVVDGKWIVTLSALACWSHWITPEIRTRRYDTRFFLAFMPEGQECRPDNRETTHGIWVNPEKALAGNLQGEIPLSPPAILTLQELLRYPAITALRKEVENRWWGEVKMPRLVPMGRGLLLLLPWDPQYGHKEIRVEAKGLEKGPALNDRPFSRLWYENGIWRPVSP